MFFLMYPSEQNSNTNIRNIYSIRLAKGELKEDVCTLTLKELFVQIVSFPLLKGLCHKHNYIGGMGSPLFLIILFLYIIS